MSNAARRIAFHHLTRRRYKAESARQQTKQWERDRNLAKLMSFRSQDELAQTFGLRRAA